MFVGQGFRDYVCEGDSITCEVDGFEVTATVRYDTNSGAPDREQDGFWPSLDPKDAGWIGPKSKATLARRMARAQAVMDAWKNDEWFWCGIVVSVSRNGIEIDGHAASLWGIECNYPVFRRGQRANAYLVEVANELLDEALDVARVRVDEMREALA
jgi:hypothetical protein